MSGAIATRPDRTVRAARCAALPLLVRGGKVGELFNEVDHCRRVYRDVAHQQEQPHRDFSHGEHPLGAPTSAAANAARWRGRERSPTSPTGVQRPTRAAAGRSRRLRSRLRPARAAPARRAKRADSDRTWLPPRVEASWSGYPGVGLIAIDYERWAIRSRNPRMHSRMQAICIQSINAGCTRRDSDKLPVTGPLQGDVWDSAKAADARSPVITRARCAHRAPARSHPAPLKAHRRRRPVSGSATTSVTPSPSSTSARSFAHTGAHSAHRSTRRTWPIGSVLGRAKSAGSNEVGQQPTSLGSSSGRRCSRRLHHFCGSSYRRRMPRMHRRTLNQRLASRRIRTTTEETTCIAGMF